jgi:hypothetical protein
MRGAPETRSPRRAVVGDSRGAHCKLDLEKRRLGGLAMANHLAILYAPGSHADAAHLSRRPPGGRPADCQFFNYGMASSAAWILP